jgi:ferritin
MSNYMNKLNLRGMGTWFRLQSEEERTHMLKLMDYLVDRGGTVELKPLSAQPSEFRNISKGIRARTIRNKFLSASIRLCKSS